MAFVIKAEVADPKALTFSFADQKTMYGGKHISEGDTIYVFASEHDAGTGLVARGVVSSAKAVRKKPGIARRTPRVSIVIKADRSGKAGPGACRAQALLAVERRASGNRA